MELRIFTEPQEGATYGELLRVARTAESLGFGAFFRSDHYLAMGTEGLPGPTDAWLTLAALARETESIRLGKLMTAATFRLPGPLAIGVAQVDEMSGGRVELGIGAGWFEAEHTAYGVPFPDVRERFDRLEESLAIITGLWETPQGETSDFRGKHYQLVDSPALPKPVQTPRPPVLLGGKGTKRTPRVAARYADEFNLPFVSLEDTKAQFRTCARGVRVDGPRPGVDDDVERPRAVLRPRRGRARTPGVRDRAEVDELRTNGLAGTPNEVVEKAGRYAEAGTERIYLQVLDLADLDHLELVAAEVLPHVA